MTGNQSSAGRYFVTIRGAILEVVGVLADMIIVKVIGCDNCMVYNSIGLAYDDREPSMRIAMIEEDAIRGQTYTVLPEFFELIHIVSDEDTGELDDFLDCM